MEITKQQLSEFYDSITAQDFKAPLMIYAFCSECQEVRLFEKAKCNSCGIPWKPPAVYVGDQKAFIA